VTLPMIDYCTDSRNPLVGSAGVSLPALMRQAVGDTMNTYKFVWQSKEQLIEAPSWTYATDIADDMAEVHGCDVRVEDLGQWGKYYVATPPPTEEYDEG